MFSTPTPTSAADVVSPTAAEVDQYQTAFRQLAKGGSDISASRAQSQGAEPAPEADLQHVWQTAVPQKERASARVGQASFLAVMAAVQLRVVAEMAKAAREEQAFAPARAPSRRRRPRRQRRRRAPPERDGARHDVLLAGASLHFRERSGGARGRELPLRAVRRAELVGEDTLRVWHATSARRPPTRA